MPPNTQPIDLVAASVAIAAAVFSPDIARFVGPYSVIFIGAFLGASWSATRIELIGRWSVVKYLAAMVTLALMVTVPIAEVVSVQSGYPVNYWFGPVATGIGSLGPDGIRKSYRLTLGWVIRRLGLKADDATPRASEKEGGTP